MSARIYLDNSATSFPKPPGVTEAMVAYAREIGASPGRGSYAESVQAGQMLQDCREAIDDVIHGEWARQVIFTLNASDALNLAIKGLVRYHLHRGHPSPRVVTTWMEHNSVLRPLNALRSEGVQATYVRCDPGTGLVDPAEIGRAITKDTVLVAVVHASNVSGTLQPVGQIGAVCREKQVPLLVDAAQSLGHTPVDVRAMHIDLLAFPGHKGLLGPLGTGALYIRPGLEDDLLPLREGGTGSVSESDVQPVELPDRYEAGSHNTIGIIGLREGVRYVQQHGVAELRRHEEVLIRRALHELTGDAAPPGLRLLGPTRVEDRTGVFSVVHQKLPPARLAELLEQAGVLTRPGLHCAPLAHRTFGTAPPQGQGSTRLSVGPYVTETQLGQALAALREICEAAVRPMRPRRAAVAA